MQTHPAGDGDRPDPARHDPAQPDADPAEELPAEVAGYISTARMLVADVLLGSMLEGADLLPRLLVRGAETPGAAADAPPRAHGPAALQVLLGASGELRAVVRGSRGALRRASAAARHAVFGRPGRRAPLPVDVSLTVGEILVDQARLTLERWKQRGQTEEARARLAARLVAAGGLDYLLDQLASDPEVRAAIRQQGAEIAAGSLGELRRRRAEADATIERTVRRLLHLPSHA